MAYHCLHTNSFSGYTEALEFISTSLQTIGWELYDDVSATEKVFTSTGENGNFTNGYIRIYSNLYYEGYMWWNTTSHTGTGKAYIGSANHGRMYVSSNNSLIVYGDKNAIVIWSATSNAIYTGMAFGYMSVMHEGYTTASGISMGSDVLVDLADSTNLLKSSYAMIIGTETEGRDRVYISDIISDTQIKISSTPRSYAAGAKIGIYPCPFFVSTSDYNVDDSSESNIMYSYVCGYQSSSTTDGTSTHIYRFDNSLFSINSYLDPDSYSQRYVLQPYGWSEQNTPYSPIGYLEHFKHAPVYNTSATYYNQHLYCVNEGVLWMGAPSDTMTSGIVDAGQTWETNELVGKIIVITSGDGLGQTRKVMSNTSDTLKIGNLWDATPTPASTYELHDEVYRNIYGFLCMKEIVE